MQEKKNRPVSNLCCTQTKKKVSNSIEEIETKHNKHCDPEMSDRLV